MSLQVLFSVAVVCLFACQLNQEWKEDKKVNDVKWGCKFVLFSLAVVCLLLISARLLCLHGTSDLFFPLLSFVCLTDQPNLDYAFDTYMIIISPQNKNKMFPKQKQLQILLFSPHSAYFLTVMSPASHVVLFGMGDQMRNRPVGKFDRLVAGI